MHALALSSGPALAADAASARLEAARALLARLGGDADSDRMWDAYKPLVLGLSRDLGLARHLEIGGGRDPLLTPEEATRDGLSVTVNDISQEELDHAPAAFRTACFDIAGDAPAGAYDLIYSRMVMEHVPDVARMWANIHGLLAPGGVAISLYPTLYAFPFVLNKLIPERMSSAIVGALFPNRTAHEDPKFPAHYDWCYGGEARMRPMMATAGFQDFAVVPFFDHAYYVRFPIVRDVHRVYAAGMRRLDWRVGTAYALMIAVKGGPLARP